MNRLQQAWVWITRISHCRGFGIQSPTDYGFVCNVVNEHWPYYAYETIGNGDDWKSRKLGQLYFRLANYIQPASVLDLVGAEKYIRTACTKAKVLNSTEQVNENGGVDLAIVPIQTEYQQLFRLCKDNSVVVFEDIYKQEPLWHCIEYSALVSVTYDLYYCGVVFFDKKRSKQNYIVNF